MISKKAIIITGITQDQSRQRDSKARSTFIKLVETCISQEWGNFYKNILNVKQNDGPEF